MKLLLSPAQQDVVVLMSDDQGSAPGLGGLLAGPQDVFPQQHSVPVLVTVAMADNGALPRAYCARIHQLILIKYGHTRGSGLR